MVRLIPFEQRDGTAAWREDAPTECAQGHRQLVPTYTGCPECGQPCRQWQCRAEGCTAPVLVDDEHVHGSRR